MWRTKHDPRTLRPLVTPRTEFDIGRRRRHAGHALSVIPEPMFFIQHHTPQNTHGAFFSVSANTPTSHTHTTHPESCGTPNTIREHFVAWLLRALNLPSAAEDVTLDMSSNSRLDDINSRLSVVCRIAVHRPLTFSRRAADPLRDVCRPIDVSTVVCMEAQFRSSQAGRVPKCLRGLPRCRPRVP